MRRLVLAMLAVPLLVSCSGGGDNPAANAPSTNLLATDSANATDTTNDTPSATPPPTPTEWTSANAQLHFISDVAAGKDDVGKLIQLYTARSQDVAAWAAVCKTLAQDDTTLARQLHTGRWPAKAKNAIAAYETVLVKRRAAYRDCAASQTMAQIFAVAKVLPNTSAQEELARVALGLPATGKK